MLLHAVPLLALLLTGCDEGAFTEFWHSGSQIAVEACIKRNASPLVAEGAIKAKCISKHQRPINTRILTGTLQPDTGESMGLILNTKITNNSSDEIITGFIVAISVARKDRPDLMFTGIFKGLWIMPNDSDKNFVWCWLRGHCLGDGSQSDEALLEEAKNLLSNGAKWSWTISQATGVGFKLRM